MAKTRQQKEGAVQELAEHLKSAKSVVFANFQGLTMKDSDEFRGQCREASVNYTASKKTLIKRALGMIGLDIDAKAFQGGISVVAGGDEVGPAKLVADFAKTHEVMTIFGGMLEGAFIDAAKVKELSKLPTKQQLLGQLVGTLNAPISGFVNVLAGNIRGLVTVLNAIKDKKPA